MKVSNTLFLSRVEISNLCVKDTLDIWQAYELRVKYLKNRIYSINDLAEKLQKVLGQHDIYFA